jgi:hypothetical protein
VRSTQRLIVKILIRLSDAYCFGDRANDKSCFQQSEFHKTLRITPAMETRITNTGWTSEQAFRRCEDKEAGQREQLPPCLLLYLLVLLALTAAMAAARATVAAIAAGLSSEGRSDSKRSYCRKRQKARHNAFHFGSSPFNQFGLYLA